MDFLSLQLCSEPLYDSISYSTFARTKVHVENQKIGKGLVKLLQKFNWTQVAVLYENSSDYITIKDVVVQEFEKQDIIVRMEKPLLTDLYGIFFVIISVK